MRRYGFDYSGGGRPQERGDYPGRGNWQAFRYSVGWYARPERDEYGDVGGTHRWGGWSGPAMGLRTGEPWGTGSSRADAVRARDIMTEAPDAVTGDTSLADVAKRMRDLDVGIVPVVGDLDGYHLEGVITDRDIAVRAAAEGKDMKKAKAKDHMTVGVATVSPGASVRDIFTVMKRERVRRVPVTDQGGRLIGIIAQADLAVDYAGLDPEREMEVEEVLERISEPARPRYDTWMERPSSRRGPARGFRGGYDRDFAGRLRHGWDAVKREARDFVDRNDPREWR
jgi:CBS domain-containing protein